MSVNIGSTAQEILNEINNKINKTTYEASAELACSSNGKVCLGKFGAYDTNITIELNSTTSKTYHATIVIWSQNVEPNATKGSVGCNVYGDADNNITPLISVFRPYGSANRQIEVYADLPGWSKNLVHIQGVAISDGGMTDVLTSVSAIPTAIDGKIKVTPINVLKSMFASKDVATTSTAGLMSAADKVKLNNVLTLASVREDSSGNVVVSNDLKVQGGADFTNDVTMGSLTVDAGLQMNDDVEINYQYGIRWTDDNDSGLVSISRNETTGKLEVHYANNSLPSGALATIGADQIKGIYLTGENRTIVGAESDVGIIWEGDGKLFKDENAITEITNTHFMTRVPIVAGNNVTFETDTDNQVVKINATGGGTSGEIDSSIIDLGEQSSHKDAQQAMVDYVISQSAENDCYLFKYWCSCYNNACFAVVYNWGTDDEIYVEGTVYDNQSSYRRFLYKNGEFTFDGCWLNIASWDEERDNLTTEEKNVIAAINEINAKVSSSSGGTPTKIENGDSFVEITESGHINITTPTTNSSEMICMTSEIVEIITENEDGYIEINAQQSKVNMEAPEVNINGSQIKIETPTGNDEMARLSSDTVEIYGKSNVDLYASNGSVSINSPSGNTSIDGKTLSLRINNTYGNAGQVLKSDGTYAYWGDVEGSGGGSSGGATLSMPRIRFANFRYDEPVYYYEESAEYTGKITFSVHVQDGTVQEGDQLQICKMGKTYNKNKLQVFMQKTITAEDIDNLAKQPYLQITTDDAAGNTHGADTTRVFNRLRHNDREYVGVRKPKYIRIRRPIYKGDRVVNALFSNVEPVDMLLKFAII